jgi:lysophospholipase L1-like esterase
MLRTPGQSSELKINCNNNQTVDMRNILFKAAAVMACILLLNNFLRAQEKKLFNWYDPTLTQFPLIEGRGWHSGLANPYDRLPEKAAASVRTPVWSLSHNSAGEYISFKTSAREIVVRYEVTGELSMPHMPATGVSGVDLYARNVDGGWNWARGAFSFGDTIQYRFSSLKLSAPEEEFRLYLPLYNSVKWLAIGVGEKESFTFQRVSKEKPVITYGTSIMQGGCASRPGLAWTNILGRKTDRQIINLGFSGNGQLEKSIIDLMTETDACLYVLDCMPNLADSIKFPENEIRNRIISAVKELQSERKDVPILLTEHSGSLENTDMDSKTTGNYQYASRIMAKTFEEMKSEGIKNIFLLTADMINLDIESTVDGTHPNDIGMMKIADAYEHMIKFILDEPEGRFSTTIPVRQRRDYATYDFMQRHEAVIQCVGEKQPGVVLVGNSITHFWGGLPDGAHKTGMESWQKYFDPLNTLNLGFGWDRIENVLWRVYHGELDGYSPEKIVVTIGTNNLSIGNTDEMIIEGLRHLLKAIKQRQNNAQIFLSGLYPRRNFEERIYTLNKKIGSLAKEMNIRYINPGILLLTKQKKIDETLFTDGLHPNSSGYQKLGASIYESLNKN